MNFVMNHAPGAGSIARPVDQQSSVLSLSYGCPMYSRIYLTYNDIVADEDTNSDNNNITDDINDGNNDCIDIENDNDDGINNSSTRNDN